MTKSDFISEIISYVEGLMLENLFDCYDIVYETHNFVNEITKNHEIQWEQDPTKSEE